MAKSLPVLLIVAVILFGAAGALLLSKGNIGNLADAFGGRKIHSVPTLTPDELMINDDSIKKEVDVVKPTESILASFIPLTVSYPTNGARVVLDKLTVTGKTLPGADVFVNDTEARADSTGAFKATISLDEGDNYILVFANDDQGNYAQSEMTVTYEVK